MNTQESVVELFRSIGEPFAAGLFEAPEKGYFYRYSCAVASWFRAMEPTAYEGEVLYPAGTKFFQLAEECVVIPHYCKTYVIEKWEELERKSEKAAAIMRAFTEESYYPSGWYHSAPNYHRILKEGLSSYRERVLARPEGEEFREGLLLVLDALEDYLKRCVAYLKSVNAPECLINALEKVPFAPAETLYEGIIAWNVIFYFDGCDNLGCLDKGLIHLYRGEDATELLSQLFLNVETNGLWSCTIGPDDNPITRQAIVAIRGKSRPLLELMVNENTPDDLWLLAAENFKVGSNGNPSFYNEKGIHDMLKGRFPQIPDEELRYFCGCGCTETNMEGYTRVGGSDGDFELLTVFEQFLWEDRLQSPTFEDFFEGLCKRTEEETFRFLDEVTGWYVYMSKYLPHPMRSLLLDDCIDKGLDVNGGGARYTWTMNADSGLINVIDSLSAIRKLVYEEKRYTPEEFLAKLKAEDPEFMAVCKSCPCYGVDDERTDQLGHDYAVRVYEAYRKKTPTADFIDAHLVTEHSFIRHVRKGLLVGPTPDGRKAKEPLCDSIAALRGKAVKGPTAMLRSAAKLPQHLAEGISVLNLTLSKALCQNTAVIPALIKGYFAQGGIQVQLTVTSVEELQDAMVHPERHKDLIVRVGGYSAYFNNLSEEVKKAIIQRNIHEGA